MIEMRIDDLSNLSSYGGKWTELIGVFFASYVDGAAQFDADFLGVFDIQQKPVVEGGPANDLFLTVPEYFASLHRAKRLVAILFKTQDGGPMDAPTLDKIHIVLLRSNRDARIVNPFQIFKGSFPTDAEPPN